MAKIIGSTVDEVLKKTNDLENAHSKVVLSEAQVYLNMLSQESTKEFAANDPNHRTMLTEIRNMISDKENLKKNYSTFSEEQQNDATQVIESIIKDYETYILWDKNKLIDMQTNQPALISQGMWTKSSTHIIDGQTTKPVPLGRVLKLIYDKLESLKKTSKHDQAVEIFLRGMANRGPLSDCAEGAIGTVLLLGIAKELYNIKDASIKEEYNQLKYRYFSDEKVVLEAELIKVKTLAIKLLETWQQDGNIFNKFNAENVNSLINDKEFVQEITSLDAVKEFLTKLSALNWVIILNGQDIYTLFVKDANGEQLKQEERYAVDLVTNLFIRPFTEVFICSKYNLYVKEGGLSTKEIQSYIDMLSDVNLYGEKKPQQTVAHVEAMEGALGEAFNIIESKVMRNKSKSMDKYAGVEEALKDFFSEKKLDENYNETDELKITPEMRQQIIAAIQKKFPDWEGGNSLK